MSVAKFYPFNGGRGRLRLGLNSIALSEWLLYEDDFKNRIHEKKQLIKSEGERVLCFVQNSINAQRELLDLLLAHIKKYHPIEFDVTDESIHSKLENVFYSFTDYQNNPLELVSYLIGDDICLLNEENDDFRLIAASVCAPTWWDLQEKIGKPLADIHAPIADLEEKIGRMIRHFLKNLKTDDCFQRSNWFLFSCPDYCVFPNCFDFYSNMKNVSLDNIESTLFLRSERQTFRRMEKTNHIVFGIKVYVEPITIAKKNLAIAEDLNLALLTMSDQQKQDLGITFVERPLRSYLAEVIRAKS
ncbi:MAG: DUF3445 domain-containing protein [Pseudomonadota bacterium]